MMLLAFVLFGALLSTLLGTIALIPAFALAVVGLGVIRPTAFYLVLKRAKMSNTARMFMGWFGPRGLSSLLLALLVVQGGAPGAEKIMAITGLVVVVSVLAHGVTATPLSSRYARKVAAAQQTMAEERESSFVGLFEPDANEIKRISPQELAAQLAGEHPPLVLDVRSRAHYESDAGQIPGSIRVLPDQIEDWISTAPTDRPIVAYCTCPDEASSGRVSRHLQEKGFDASALRGGYKAWEALYPVEPKGLVSVAAVG
jgi:NhaP-type Na+/H+ or K+/H+ antiporter